MTDAPDLNDPHVRREQRLAARRTHEAKARDERCLYGGASVEDHLAFAKDELLEADDCLPPNAPDNGRAVDWFHASCCVERATVAIRLAEKLIRGVG